MSVTYTKASDYYGTAATIQEKITKIDTIIDALIVLSGTAVEGEIYDSYTLNDGQTIISARYRGQSAILAAINGYENLKQRYINQLQGHVFTLVPGKSFPGC